MKLVEVVNNTPSAIALKQTDATFSGIQAELSSTNIAAGQKVQLKITTEFPKDRKRLAGYVILRSNLSVIPQLKLLVSVRLSTH